MKCTFQSKKESGFWDRQITGRETLKLDATKHEEPEPAAVQGGGGCCGGGSKKKQSQ